MEYDVDGAPGRFRAFRDQADELLRLGLKAAADPRLREVQSFSQLLRGVLPEKEEKQASVARALRMKVTDLAALRRGELDPFVFPQDPLIAIARTVGVPMDRFMTMIGNDHERTLSHRTPTDGLFAPISSRATMRAEDVFAEVERIWEQAEDAGL